MVTCAHAKEFAPPILDRWHAYLQAYQVMPADLLLEAREVKLTVSLKDLISREGLRARCELCGEEIFNEREVRKGGKVLCKACAAKAYYQ